MRSTAKVFLILSMVWGGISVLTGGAYVIASEMAAAVISIASGAMAFVVSLFALRALKRAKTRRDLRVIGILTLLFANVVAGILFLCMNEYELGDTRSCYQNQPPYGQAPYGQAPYGQAPYGQAPYNQTPPQNQNVPPYGGVYGAPYAAKKEDTPTDSAVEDTSTDTTDDTTDAI